MSPYSEKYYVSRDGLDKLKKEYKKLLEARGNESAEPDELSKTNERIEELDLVFKSCEVIKIPPKGKRDFVALGATVVVEVDGQIDELTVVGTLEANPSLGKISNASPVGKALLGCRLGDEVVVSSSIKSIYKIKGIKYEDG